MASNKFRYRPQAATVGLLIVLVLVAGWAARGVRDAGVAVPAAAFDPAPTVNGSQTAVLAGGCFWGVQAVFEHVGGVSHVLAGYSGGEKINPTYEDVSTETTGHAESV